MESFHSLLWVLGKMPPGRMPPGKMPPGKVPQEKIAYFVKLPHIMEYLNGKNIVNFNFRQS